MVFGLGNVFFYPVASHGLVKNNALIARGCKSSNFYEQPKQSPRQGRKIFTEIIFVGADKGVRGA